MIWLHFTRIQHFCFKLTWSEIESRKAPFRGASKKLGRTPSSGIILELSRSRHRSVSLFDNASITFSRVESWSRLTGLKKLLKHRPRNPKYSRHVKEQLPGSTQSPKRALRQKQYNKSWTEAMCWLRRATTSSRFHKRLHVAPVLRSWNLRFLCCDFHLRKTKTVRAAT